LLSLFTAELSLLVSVRELLDRSVLVAAEPESLGLAVDELEEVDGPETVPLAEPDGVETEPLADPLGLLLVWAMAPPTSPKVTRAMSRRTATLFMLHLRQWQGSNGDASHAAMATMTRSPR
jgi:hypothetical protein